MAAGLGNVDQNKRNVQIFSVVEKEFLDRLDRRFYSTKIRAGGTFNFAWRAFPVVSIRVNEIGLG